MFVIFVVVVVVVVISDDESRDGGGLESFLAREHDMRKSCTTSRVGRDGASRICFSFSLDPSCLPVSSPSHPIITSNSKSNVTDIPPRVSSDILGRTPCRDLAISGSIKRSRPAADLRRQRVGREAE